MIFGKFTKSAIRILVEGSTGAVMMLRVPGTRHRTAQVCDRLIRPVSSLSDGLRDSLTWDEGA